MKRLKVILRCGMTTKEIMQRRIRMIAVVDADSCIYQAAWQRETVEDALDNTSIF